MYFTLQFALRLATGYIALWVQIMLIQTYSISLARDNGIEQ
jgi:hypothetical protein